MVSVQKMLAKNVNFPLVTPQYADEFVKRSKEITENMVNVIRINNQLTVNPINAAAENFRTLNRTIESVIVNKCCCNTIKNEGFFSALVVVVAVLRRYMIQVCYSDLLSTILISIVFSDLFWYLMVSDTI